MDYFFNSSLQRIVRTQWSLVMDNKAVGGSLQRVRQPFDIHNIESHYKVFWALTKALFSILMITWY